MQPGLAPDVAAANGLTRKWCTTMGSDDFAVSGYGVWPLLTLLTAVATGPVHSELRTATGWSTDTAHDAALTLLGRLENSDAVRAALGIWTGANFPLREEWVRSLPSNTVSALGDRDGLDDWVREHTDGLVDRFPAEIGESTALVLATAVIARTTWRNAFQDGVLEPVAGPWRGYRGPALSRYSRELRDAALLGHDTPVTRAVVRGVSDLDVHLLLGTEDARPGAVLATGMDALDGSVEIRTPVLGDRGPGLSVREVTAVADALRIHLPPFDIRSAHDLLDRADLFGLRSAAGTVGGENMFPGLSSVPLTVTAAAQGVRARFTAEGFHAAAVTSVLMAPTGIPRPHDAREIAVDFDRPFGFLAVHRDTGAVVVAGWVATPGA